MERAMLRFLDHVPGALLDCTAHQVADVLGGPTLIHLHGRRPQPLFVSVLLHGNEHTGLHAIQRVLQKYQGMELPRALSIFVGNVEAARRNLRRLDHQPDYNRVWSGGPARPCAEAEMMARVVDEMRARTPFASIDVHNNTGLNPHYACVDTLDQRFLHLATLFSRVVVYFTEPRGVQSSAFAKLCPAVTVECGKSGTTGGDTHAAEFIDAVLHLSQFPHHAVAPRDIDLYHTVATVKIPEDVSFSFNGGDADVRFPADVELLNFRDLRPGTDFGVVAPQCATPLLVPEGNGGNRWRDFFEVTERRLVLRCGLTPAMLCADVRAVRQDCLCYLLERLPPPAA
jgi:succinylglutamate desuccinylase